MNITPRNRFFTHALLAAAVTLLAAAPTAQAARAKKQAAPAPVVAAEPASPYTLEIGFTADSAANDIFKNKNDQYVGKVGTIGADLTGVYALDENRAITLRLGYGTGSADGDFFDGQQHDEWEVTRLTLMPGFRYTKPWGAKTHYFIGANVGLVQQSVEYTCTRKDQNESTSWSGDSTGLGYSAEIGLTYKYSEKVSLLIAYQLSGSTNQTELSIYEDEKSKCEQQMYHTIRAGVSVKF